jgi:predicted Zn finger-like uncharacterized protein
MDIRCERCATEYEIEDAQIPEAGLTIKCATCAHVFKVRRGMAPPPPPIALKLYRDGQTLSAICPDPATLQQWIVEQRILPTDDVSISGQPWRRLGDVPEFNTFFALLSMPPPPSMREAPSPAPPSFGGGDFTPVSGGTLPFQTPAPAATPTSAMATVQRPTLQWAPQDPAGATAISTPKASMPTPPPAQDDNVRTIQIQLTPDMFPPARSAEPRRNTGTTPPVPPAPPAPQRPEPAPTAAWPALPSNFGTEPLKLESLGGPIPTAGSTPKVTPVAKPPATRPATPSAKAAAAKPPAVKAKPVSRKPEVDPDLAEFMTGRSNGRLVVGVIAGLAVVGAGGYFGYQYVTGEHGPSANAKAAFEKGRKLYLTDTASDFLAAENDYKEAIGATPGTYPQAEGAMAELHAASAEQMLQRYTAMQAEMTAMASAGKEADAKVLLPRANELFSNFKEKLNTAREEVNAARKNEASSLEGNRALLDYYRLLNDAGHAAQAAEALKNDTDPETLAHLAAWHAGDPKLAASAEAELKSAIEKEPQFVRARGWLAELHIKQGNTAAAMKDMEGILKIAPRHERASEYIEAQKAAGTTVVANTPPANPPANPPPANPSADANPPETPKAETPKAETAKAEPVKKAEPVSDKDKEPVVASGDVDKLIDQAGRFLENKKAARALEFYDRALKVKPALCDALYGRGLALYDLGRTDDAISAFKTTLDHNHKFGDAMIGIAEAYKKEKKNKDAVKYYREYLDMYPTGEQAQVAKANVDALQ